MNITFAQYFIAVGDTEHSCINCVIDGADYAVPLDPANRHYAEIMRQVEAGELTIQEADT
jgi:hypothetical protein